LGQVLIIGHGVILGFWLLRLDNFLLFDLLLGNWFSLSQLHAILVFLALGNGPLSLLGIVLIRTPVVTTSATLLNLFSATGARSTIVGALPVTGWAASATSSASFAVVLVAVYICFGMMGVW